MPDILDLDAIANESTKEPFPFRFGGEVYTLPGQIDLRLLAEVADLPPGRPDLQLAALLGAEQWRRVMASPAPFPAAAIERLMAGWSEYIGISLGESSASAGS